MQENEAWATELRDLETSIGVPATLSVLVQHLQGLHGLRRLPGLDRRFVELEEDPLAAEVHPGIPGPRFRLEDRRQDSLDRLDVLERTDVGNRVDPGEAAKCAHLP